MKKQMNEPLQGELLDEDFWVALEELCRLSQAPPVLVTEMVAYGFLTPRGRMQTEWQFSGFAVTRVKQVLRLQHDLEVNLQGAVVIVEMLEELHQLRHKLRQLE